MTSMLDLRVGPVPWARGVKTVLAEHQISHRDLAFQEEFATVRARLQDSLGCRRAYLLIGTGTLANDVVCAQIGATGTRGLVMANGEFGERLGDHVRRAQLPAKVDTRPWGFPITPQDVEEALEESGGDWIFLVHTETSTGVMAPLNEITQICQARGVKVFVDCASSLGNTGIDLSAVSMASGATNKGLRVPPGLALILSNQQPDNPMVTPRYLDLSLYEGEGPPFTHSWHLVRALGVALRTVMQASYHRALVEDTLWFRKILRAEGFNVIGPDEFLAPAIVSVAIQSGKSSESVARALEEKKILVSWQSAYLKSRNWMQFSLMGRPSRQRLAKFVYLIGREGLG